MGGVAGAIEAAVERALQLADEDPRIPRAREARLQLLRLGLIPWLTGIDPTTGSVRRRVANLHEVPEVARPLLELLAQQRLFSVDRDERTGATTIEPAHEAVLRQWPLLDGWLREDATALAILAGVQRSSRDWEANARQEDWLGHTAGRLEDLGPCLRRDDLRAFLSASDHAYLRACQVLDEQRRAQVRRVHHNLGLVLAEKADRAWQELYVNEARVFCCHSLALLDPEQPGGVSARTLGERLSHPEQIPLAHRFELDGEVDDAALSPDGALLAVAIGTEVRLWDLASGSLTCRLAADPGYFLERVVFSPTCGLLALGARARDNAPTLRVQVWDLAGRTWVAKRDWPQCSFADLALSPRGDELVLAATHGNGQGNSVTIDRWDLRTDQIESSRTWVEEAHLRGIALSDGGTALATWMGGQVDQGGIVSYTRPLIRLRSLEDPTQAARDLTDGSMDGGIYRLAFSLDRRTAAAVAGKQGATGYQIQCWDLVGGHTYPPLTGIHLSLPILALSPDGRILATVAEARPVILLWDVRLGRVLARLVGTGWPVHRLAFSPDGRLIVAASGDHAVCCWQMTGWPPPMLAEPSGRGFLAFDQACQALWATVAGIGMSSSNGLPANRIQASFTEKATCTALSPDGQTLAVALGNGGPYWIDLFQATTGERLGRLTGHAGFIEAMAFSPDGRWLAATGQAHLEACHLWQLEAITEALAPAVAFTWGGSCLAFSPDGQLFACGAHDREVRLWNRATGGIQERLPHTNGELLALAFSADSGTLAMVLRNGTVRLWDHKLRRFRNLELVVERSSLGQVAFSPDGRLLAMALDASVQLWNLATGQLLADFRSDHPGHPAGLAFAPDGSSLAYLLNGFHQWSLEDLRTGDWDVQARKEEARFGRKLDGVVLTSGPIRRGE